MLSFRVLLFSRMEPVSVYKAVFFTYLAGRILLIWIRACASTYICRQLCQTVSRNRSLPSYDVLNAPSTDRCDGIRNIYGTITARVNRDTIFCCVPNAVLIVFRNFIKSGVLKCFLFDGFECLREMKLTFDHFTGITDRLQRPAITEAVFTNTFKTIRKLYGFQYQIRVCLLIGCCPCCFRTAPSETP